EPGEFRTRGYLVMSGYWEDPERTAEAVDHAGWMHTGDLATMDEDGYVRIVGRIKDMIIRGGENLYPREIEEFLYGHPDVADVQGLVAHVPPFCGTNVKPPLMLAVSPAPSETAPWKVPAAPARVSLKLPVTLFVPDFVGTVALNVPVPLPVVHVSPGP